MSTNDENQPPLESGEAAEAATAAPVEAVPAAETPEEDSGGRNSRRTLRGTVTSDRMEKTITVRVERTFRHPKYGKFVRRHSKYLAHDERGEATVGDTVEIAATRPLSKTKRWRLIRVLRGTVLGEDDTGARTERAVRELAAPSSAAAPPASPPEGQGGDQ